MRLQVEALTGAGMLARFICAHLTLNRHVKGTGSKLDAVLTAQSFIQGMLTVYGTLGNACRASGAVAPAPSLHIDVLCPLRRAEFFEHRWYW